jgi:hypothetical protein
VSTGGVVIRPAEVKHEVSSGVNRSSVNGNNTQNKTCPIAHIANTAPQKRLLYSLPMLSYSSIFPLLHVCFDKSQTLGVYQVGIGIVVATAEVSMEGDEMRCSLHVCSRCSVLVD